MILLIKIIILVKLEKKSGFSKETIHHLMSQQTPVKKPIPFRPVTYDHVSRLYISIKRLKEICYII